MKTRTVFSEKKDLLLKAKDSIISAVQIFNNPLASFRSESFIVLSMIGWTYLLHAYYRQIGEEYRYYDLRGTRKRFDKNPDGSYRYWDLSDCVSQEKCPLDKDTVNNLNFLIGLRNQIVHRKSPNLDYYLSARYQACALNFNYYIKKLFGQNYSLDNYLALSLQFSELDYTQAEVIKDKQNKIPKEIQSYIAKFDDNLNDNEISSDRFAYRLLFTKIAAKRKGQADRVIEFVDPQSPLAENITKEYWLKIEKEKPKFSPSQVVETAREAGFTNFTLNKHAELWKRMDAKNPSKGYGAQVVKAWYRYQNWVDIVLIELKNAADGSPNN